MPGISAISTLAMAGPLEPLGPLGGTALEPCSGWTSSAAGNRPWPVLPGVWEISLQEETEINSEVS